MKNIAEILKDCPSGMELDCTMYDNLYFDRVDNDLIYCYYELDGCRNIIMFYENGCYTAHKLSKCVIFPKGKTTWEGFQRPFKDGDVVYIQSLYEYIAIYKKTNCKNLYKHAAICISFNNRFLQDINLLCCEEDVKQIRFATKEEKQKLFEAIKANGYKWNPETKTLEKLITLKFKIGDKIRAKGTNSYTQILGIKWYQTETYYETLFCEISVKDQDKFELVPNKFDITTLKPFDKVLVRESDEDIWSITMYSHYAADKCYPFVTIFLSYPQCIPYEGNESLLGKADDCDDFYKTWE